MFLIPHLRHKEKNQLFQNPSLFLLLSSYQNLKWTHTNFYQCSKRLIMHLFWIPSHLLQIRMNIHNCFPFSTTLVNNCLNVFVFPLREHVTHTGFAFPNSFLLKLAKPQNWVSTLVILVSILLPLYIVTCFSINLTDSCI